MGEESLIKGNCERETKSEGEEFFSSAGSNSLMLKLKQQQNEIVEITKKYGRDKNALIPILKEIQSRYNYISEEKMQIIANILDIPTVHIYGVVSFYSFLYDKPHGNFVIRLCKSIACKLAGADEIARQLECELGIKFGQTTTDGKFTLEWVNCLGLCDQGPAMMVNDQAFVKLTREKVYDIIKACKQTI